MHKNATIYIYLIYKLVVQPHLENCVVLVTLPLQALNLLQLYRDRIVDVGKHPEEDRLKGCDSLP